MLYKTFLLKQGCIPKPELAEWMSININELANDLGVKIMHCKEDILEDLVEYFECSENFDEYETCIIIISQSTTRFSPPKDTFEGTCRRLRKSPAKDSRI